jgi:phage replication-related protein YjqB (UPF0714/DUF867 family)
MNKNNVNYKKKNEMSRFIIFSPHSSRVEQNTVNIKVECSNHSEGLVN